MQRHISSMVEGYTQRFHVRRPYVPDAPARDLSLIITIPSYKEPDIARTLQALASCHAPSGGVEVIVTINAPEGASEGVLAINSDTLQQIKRWEQNNKNDFLKMLIIREEEIPKKHAGAGWARKIGMDEAVQRWAMINRDGPILCLDADCIVSENYLVEAEKTFADPRVRVGHFYFEHPYEQEQDPLLREGILHYELHLRCYIHGLKVAGYPFAVHTVGSCMVVRSSVYAKAGGMNRRKAGEDFYFLHKVAPGGGWRNINEATVFPSCRASDRVPFGTGRAQLEWQKKTSPGITYNVDIYLALKPLFEALSKAYEEELNLNRLLPEVKDFLEGQKVFERIKEMKSHSNSREGFVKRMWQWMDGFLVLKLTHYLRDHGFADQPVLEVAKLLLERSGNSWYFWGKKLEDVLAQFRKLDRC